MSNVFVQIDKNKYFSSGIILTTKKLLGTINDLVFINNLPIRNRYQ